MKKYDVMDGNTDVTAKATVAIKEEGNTYTVTFSKLPRKVAGDEIAYTVTEDPITGYSAEVGDPVKVKDGEYTVAITNTMKFGKLKVTKVLPKYETSNENGTTFVFRVIAKVGDNQILDQVMSINMDSAGSKTAWLPVLLPEGATVTVTEEYSGTAYELSGQEPSGAVTISADTPQEVTFTNDYNDEITQSYGILNTYQKSEEGWGWLSDIKDSLGFTDPGNATQAPADQNTGE